MAEQPEQNRTEKATPFKLEEARKRGQVSKSLEVNSFLLLLAILGLSYFAGAHYAGGLLALCRDVLAGAHQFPAEAPLLLPWVDSILGGIIALFWSFVAVIVGVAILSNMLQTGPIFSFFPLKPDIQRMNPVAGFKRLFSLRLLFETVKTALKIGVFGFVIYLVLMASLPKLLALMDTNPDAYLPFLLRHGQELLYKLLLVLLLIVFLDIAFTRWEYSRRMRMSHREIKEELKRREGDPQIRARLRELRREAARRAGAVRKVPDADVLITNPARLALALRYDSERMVAPRLVAKGAGELAARMREAARRHGVPVVENRELAQALFRRVALDAEVPQDLYPTVARILAWIFLQRQGRGAAPA